MSAVASNFLFVDQFARGNTSGEQIGHTLAGVSNIVIESS
jgi:hypothetical protein